MDVEQGFKCHQHMMEFVIFTTTQPYHNLNSQATVQNGPRLFLSVGVLVVHFKDPVH